MLKYDYSKDLYTGEQINLDLYKKKLLKFREETKKKTKNVYSSQIAQFYYKDKYNKYYEDVLSEFFEVPKCKITNKPVTLLLSGVIKFQLFSRFVSRSEMNTWVEENVESKKKHSLSMKISRKGAGNPVYGKPNFFRGKTKETNESLKKKSLQRKGKTLKEFYLSHGYSEREASEKEQLQRMRQSQRKIGNKINVGRKHSKEWLENSRKATLRNYANGVYKHTRSSIHLKVKKILEELNVPFVEESVIGYYSFDFQCGNVLIEVQGDYFHCNPNLSKYSIPKSKIQKKNVERDVRKKSYIKNNTSYNLVEFWENDINNNLEQVKLCLEKLFKLKK